MAGDNAAKEHSKDKINTGVEQREKRSDGKAIINQSEKPTNTYKEKDTLAPTPTVAARGALATTNKKGRVIAQPVLVKVHFDEANPPLCVDGKTKVPATFKDAHAVLVNRDGRNSSTDVVVRFLQSEYMAEVPFSSLTYLNTPKSKQGTQPQPRSTAKHSGTVITGHVSTVTRKIQKPLVGKPEAPQRVKKEGTYAAPLAIPHQTKPRFEDQKSKKPDFTSHMERQSRSQLYNALKEGVKVRLHRNQKAGHHDVTNKHPGFDGATGTVVKAPEYPNTWLQVRLDGDNNVVKVRTSQIILLDPESLGLPVRTGPAPVANNVVNNGHFEHPVSASPKGPTRTNSKRKRQPRGKPDSLIFTSAKQGGVAAKKPDSAKRPASVSDKDIQTKRQRASLGSELDTRERLSSLLKDRISPTSPFQFDMESPLSNSSVTGSSSTMHMAYCLSIVKAIWHQMFDEEMSPLSDEETSDMAITIRNSTLVDGHGLRVIAHQLEHAQYPSVLASVGDMRRLFRNSYRVRPPLAQYELFQVESAEQLLDHLLVAMLPPLKDCTRAAAGSCANEREDLGPLDLSLLSEQEETGGSVFGPETDIIESFVGDYLKSPQTEEPKQNSQPNS
eukprot:m.69151 g.69151  ORF g.69151 m.69151 type:complete len:614 (-) comp12030_c0_seq1:99-1940(-)